MGNESRDSKPGPRMRALDRLALRLCLLAILALGATAAVSGASRTRPAPACPKDAPGVAFYDRALIWAAGQDGIPIPPGDDGPLTSPVLPEMSQLVGPLSVSPRLRPLLEKYQLVAKGYTLDQALGQCYFLLFIKDRRPDGMKEIAIDTASMQVYTVAEIMRLRAAVPTPVPRASIDARLLTRMSNMTDSETALVYVWFRSDPGMDVGTRQQRAFEELARTIPKAAENMRQHGKPFGPLPDPENVRIEQEYSRLMAEGVTNAAMERAFARLAGTGIVVRTIPPIPALSARLSRRLLEQFAADPGVASLELGEALTSNATATAIVRSNAGRICMTGYDEASSTLRGYAEAAGCFSSSCPYNVAGTVTGSVSADALALRFDSRFELTDPAQPGDPIRVCTADCGRAPRLPYTLTGVLTNTRYAVFLSEQRIGEYLAPAANASGAAETCAGAR